MNLSNRTSIRFNFSYYKIIIKEVYIKIKEVCMAKKIWKAVEVVLVIALEIIIIIGPVKGKGGKIVEAVQTVAETN